MKRVKRQTNGSRRNTIYRAVKSWRLSFRLVLSEDPNPIELFFKNISKITFLWYRFIVC